MNNNYVEFFLNSKSSIVLLECIELIHPNFSQTHRVVRNATHGVTVTHEDEVEAEYVYYPLRIQPSKSEGDLDYSLEIEFGDLGGRLQAELDGIREADGFQIKPTCIMRGYRSDNLQSPIQGPLVLEVNEISFNYEGAQFEANAPFKNIGSTGEIYSLNRFPMLRGFL